MDEEVYRNLFADAIHLNHTPKKGILRRDPLRLLDNETLQRLKKEKLGGASNIYDVPNEFLGVGSAHISIVDHIEYRTTEKVKGLDRCPLARHRHKVALHCIREPGLVQRWLDDGWSL